MKFARLFLIVIGFVLIMPSTHPLLHAQEFHLEHDAEHNVEQTAENGKQQAIEYVCPMHSHIVSDEPGTCPICGMDLEPQQRAEQVNVAVSGQMQQNLGIQTAAATYDTLWRYYP